MASIDKKPNRSAAKGSQPSKNGQSITQGMRSIGELRKTSKQRSQAQAEIRDIERAIEDDRDELSHRIEVDKDYDAIVAEQTRAINRATKDEKAATDKANAEQRRLDQLKDELSAMKESHEQKLRPYRNLMDSSRGRSDDAAKQLASTKRDVRRAEGDLSEATKRRTQRIANAHQAVDNSKDRLASIMTELETTQGDPEAKPAAVQKLQDEYAAQQRQLQHANEEVTQVTQECQEEVDKAQQYLWRKQRELTKCEQNADSAKQEAATHKDEYDTLYREAQDKERAKQDEIRSAEKRVAELEQAASEAAARRIEAQELLDEANDIHTHPEHTETLRNRIADAQQDLKDVRQELTALTASEKELRRSTRTARIAVVAGVIVAILIVILIIWLALPKQ